MLRDPRKTGRSPHRRLFVLLALFLVASALCTAQDVRHKQVYYPTPVFDRLEDWLGRAGTLRRHVTMSTGLAPALPREIRVARLADVAEFEGFSVQSVALETMPGLYLAGTIYRPTEGAGPFPAVLAPHGHWGEGRLHHSEEASMPGRSISMARHGFVVLSYSMIGYNETADAIEHRFNEPAYELWGFSAAGLQLWNSVHALDYLLTMPEVDPGRIGVTGASGGGTQTFLLTAIDDRIAVSAPVNMISAHYQGGCVCENPPLLRVDATNVEIGALAAPRPLLMISTSGDWTSDTPTVEYPAIRDIYDLFDASDRVKNVHLDYPHNYNRDSRDAAYAWFARWMQQGSHGWSEGELPVLPDSLLLIDLPAAPASADDLFRSFRSLVENQMPSQVPALSGPLAEYRETYGRLMREVLSAGAAPDTPIPEVKRPSDWTEAGPVELIVFSDDGEASTSAADAARAAADQGRAVALLDLRAVPRLAFPEEEDFPSTYNPTPDALAVRAIAQTARALADRPEISEVHLTGIGQAGARVFLAAALFGEARSIDVDLQNVDYEDDDDYLRNAAIPLIRRLGGMKTASAMLVPTPLRVSNVAPGSFSTWLESLYDEGGIRDLLMAN